jgi:hypothetical protein
VAARPAGKRPGRAGPPEAVRVPARQRPRRVEVVPRRQPPMPRSWPALRLVEGLRLGSSVPALSGQIPPLRGPLAGPLQAGLHTRVVLALGWPYWLAADRESHPCYLSTGCGNLVCERQRAPCGTCSSCREGVIAEGLSLPIRRLEMSPVHRRCRGWTGASWLMSGRRAIQSALGGVCAPRPALGLSEPVRCQVRGPVPLSPLSY